MLVPDRQDRMVMSNAEEAIPLMSATPNATVKRVWSALSVEKGFEQALQDPASKPPPFDAAI
jgi:hypothetical protein